VDIFFEYVSTDFLKIETQLCIPRYNLTMVKESQTVQEALDTIALIQTLVKDIPPKKVSPSEAIFWLFKALGSYKV
jgi:hypothetical protein